MTRAAEASQAPLTVDTRVDPKAAVTEITVYSADHPGLFSQLAGALALAGANIVDAKILTMANGMALDTFWVQDADGGAFDRSDKLAKLAVLFEHVLAGERDPYSELSAPKPYPSRTRVFTVPPRVVIDNRASATPHGHRGQRPRPSGAAVRAHPRADAAQSADLLREDFHLRREGGGRLLCEGSVRPQDRPRAAAADIRQRLVDVLAETAAAAPTPRRRADEVAAQ